MAQERLGINAKMYYASGGSWDSETWTVLDRVENLSYEIVWDTTPSSDRGTGLKTEAKTMVGVNATGRIKINESDTAYLAFIAFAIIRTPVNLLILNGASTDNGAAGVKGYFNVKMSGESQGMGDVGYKNFTLSAAFNSTSNPFKSVIVSGGAPVYTSLGLPT